jgi:hypothetical protein
VLKLQARVVASVRSEAPNHTAESSGGVLTKKPCPSEATVWPSSSQKKAESGEEVESARACARTRMSAPAAWHHTPMRKQVRRPYTERSREDGRAKMI